MPNFVHDGIGFHHRENGAGRPFVFQHGLGGDVDQPFGLFRPPAGVRLLAFDFRAHGETPMGDPDSLSIATFADDLIAFLDHLGLEHATVGGISLGAAVALNAALRYPERVAGLVLSRPAWLDGPAPPNLAVYALISGLIREHGAREGLERFRSSQAYAAVLRESPDAANSLLGQFTHPRAEEALPRLERLPLDAPCPDRSGWPAIRVPALVIGTRRDPIHPFAYAEALAVGIPNARLVEITPKSESRERHAEEVQRALSEFLAQG